MLLRRQLFAVPLLSALLPPPAPGWTLRPGPNDRHVAVVDGPGVTWLLLPGPDCRLLGSLTLAGAPCIAARFWTTTRGGEPIELLAVATAEGLVALEPWSGLRADGAHFETSLTVLPDGRGMLLSRDGALPHSHRTRWQRQSWTDPFALVAGRLAPAPIRSPVEGTWQSNVAGRRMEVLARLEPATHVITPSLVALTASWPWDETTG